MTKRRYTAELKREAARMVIIEGQSVPEVAGQLGVNPNLSYRWKAEHLEELEGSRPSGSASPGRRLRRLEHCASSWPSRSA